jgi:elongation factor P
MLDFTEIKLGKVINYQGAPCVITKCDFMKVQQSKPTKKSIMRNLITGQNLEYTFKAGDSAEEADIKRLRASYMYRNGNELSFMMTDTYETIEIDTEVLGGKEGYLVEGQDLQIVFYNELPIAVDVPIKVTLEVVNTTDAVKGNTVSDVYKDATMNTGITLKVPAFIKIGEKVIFNTVEDEYAGRESN